MLRLQLTKLGLRERNSAHNSVHVYLCVCVIHHDISDSSQECIYYLGTSTLRARAVLPGGTVVENTPASAADMGIIPRPGRFRMPWSIQARTSQPPKPTCS